MATKTEQQTCTHCHGTGIEPQPDIRPEWAPILEQIRDIGQRRKAVATKRNLEDILTREETTKELIAAHDEARAIGVPKWIVAQTAGVSRYQFDNILKGTPGGKR